MFGPQVPLRAPLLSTLLEISFHLQNFDPEQRAHCSWGRGISVATSQLAHRLEIPFALCTVGQTSVHVYMHMYATYMCAFRFVCFYFQHAHAHTSLAYKKYMYIRRYGTCLCVGIVHRMQIERCTLHQPCRHGINFPSYVCIVDESDLLITPCRRRRRSVLLGPSNRTLSRTCVSLDRAYNQPPFVLVLI